MPLPDAPDPDKSRLYSQLASKTPESISSDNFETLKDAVYLDRNSEDELRRLNLIGQVTGMQSASGPLVGGAGIESVSQDSGSEPAVIRPPKNQVWQIQAVNLVNSLALTGNQNYYLFMSTAATMASSTLPTAANGDCQQSSTGSSATTLAWETLHEDLGGGPLQITHDLFLRWYGNFANTQTGNILTWNVGYIRVR